VKTPQSILFIQKSAGRGGSKNRLLDTLTTLKEGTHCQLHVISSEVGEFTERCAKLGVSVSLHPLPEWRKFWSRLCFSILLKNLASQLPFKHIDWVVSNEMWWAPHASSLARRLGGKSAAIIRDGVADSIKGRKYRLQDIDKILPSSAMVARKLSEDPALAKQTEVFFDAVILPPTQFESQKLLDEKLFPAKPDVKRWLLVLGRVQKRKNQADTVRVLKGLLDKGHTDLGLMVAGDLDTEYKPLMDEVIKKCALQDRVVMLGNFPDIQTLFFRSSLCLLTSHREALPGSIMESCMAGLPCFMYPSEGAEDIFGPHQPLFVSADFIPEMLVEKIDYMLRNPDRLANLAYALQARAQQLFSQEAHLREFVKKFSLREG
jgi:glycosyltransferase involved in cell wall biosynthesis